MSQQPELLSDGSDEDSASEFSAGIIHKLDEAQKQSQKRGPDGRVLQSLLDSEGLDEFSYAFSDGSSSDEYSSSSEQESEEYEYETQDEYEKVSEEEEESDQDDSAEELVNNPARKEWYSAPKHTSGGRSEARSTTEQMRAEVSKHHTVLENALESSLERHPSRDGSFQSVYDADEFEPEQPKKRQRTERPDGHAAQGKDWYTAYWSQWKIRPEQREADSGQASSDGGSARKSLFDILNGGTTDGGRRTSGAADAHALDEENRVRLLTPTEAPYADDTFSATIDSANNVLCDDANQRVYTLLNCDVNGFVKFEDQFTNVRGVLESQQQLLVDLTMRHVVETRALDDEVRAFDDAQALREEYARQEQPLDLQDFVSGVNEVDVYRDRLETLGAKLPGTKHMNPDRAFVPAKSPMLARLDDIRNARLRADGLSDIVRAMATCPICRHAGSSNSTPDVASAETIALYAYWSEVCAMTCKEIPWQVMAEYWNDQFVKPFTEQNRKPPVPELTPSHMDIHFSECLVSNIIPDLVRHHITLREAEKCVTDSGVFTEERVAGKSTGKMSLSKNGFAVLERILKLQHTVQKDITNYSMTARMLQGTAVAPLAGMLCEQKQLNLNTFFKLRPQKNESREENASRVMRGLLGSVKR